MIKDLKKREKKQNKIKFYFIEIKQAEIATYAICNAILINIYEIKQQFSGQFEQHFNTCIKDSVNIKFNLDISYELQLLNC